jgi:hypothetical protein
METSARQVSDSKASRTRTPGASAAAASSTGNRLNHTSDLYELWTLDIIPAIGCRVAEIFETNPKQFKRVPPNVADVLAKLHYQTGYNDSYLSISQRLRLVGPLLGESDGANHSDETSKFHQAATGLRKAAVDYVQRSFDTGERQLRNAFRDAAKTMYAYLTVLEGGVTTSALGRLSTHFGDVVTVLQNVEYCSGLGLPPAPSGRWPRFGILDGDGAAVIADLTHRVIPDESMTVAQIDVEKFLAIQRAADYGAASLDEVLVDPTMEDDARADEVINIVYRWWTALRDAGVLAT